MKSKETESRHQKRRISGTEPAKASRKAGISPETPGWRVPSGFSLGEFGLRFGFVAGRLLKSGSR